MKPTTALFQIMCNLLLANRSTIRSSTVGHKQDRETNHEENT
jgi:hypothetical protein